jgi:uncharacterized protein (DUF427 family)
MGLMTGTGPLSRQPAGSFNFQAPRPGWAVYLESSPKRVRVIVAGETIADSRQAMLLQESGAQPSYYFPPDDVRAEVLSATERHTHCPKKGDASYYTIRVGETELENAAWYYPEPLPDAPPQLRGLIAFYFDRMDRWLEEDEEIVGHPRDPYHRIDTIPTSRHIRVSLDGELLAESRNAVALFESNLQTRWYLPRADVRASLTDSELHTICPYKGTASYYSVALESGSGAEDLVWYYSDPRPEALRIKDLLCFYNERVEIELAN